MMKPHVVWIAFYQQKTDLDRACGLVGATSIHAAFRMIGAQTRTAATEAGDFKNLRAQILSDHDDLGGRDVLGQIEYKNGKRDKAKSWLAPKGKALNGVRTL